MTPPVPVLVRHISRYDPEPLQPLVENLLSSILPGLKPRTRVLVKPNLVAAKNVHLSCTHPHLIGASAKTLKDMGLSVVVGDSPAFGSARQVAGAGGLDLLLKRLGVELITLNHPVCVELPSGIQLGFSRHALETDIILNLPKLKAHGQMRLTGAVKNLFGCVVGTRKALAHFRHGDQGTTFQAMLADIMASLPPAPGLMDAITAMHRTGPIKGDPFDLHLLAASSSSVALDTACFSILGAEPGSVPLWEECRRRNMPGSRIDDIEIMPDHLFPGPIRGFHMPLALEPQRFCLTRMALSSCRRIVKKICPP